MSLQFSDPLLSNIYEGGAPLNKADIVILGFHGKGGNADVMLERMAAAAEGTNDVAYFAPESARQLWFRGDTVPADHPELVAVLKMIDKMIATINAAGIPTENIILAGHSQGSVIVNEYLASRGVDVRDVVSFSGAMVTPVGEALETTEGKLLALNPDPMAALSDNFQKFIPNEYDKADLTGQTIELAVHSKDPKVPLELVLATADYYRSKGAQVDMHVEIGQSHTVTPYEIDQLRSALRYDRDHDSFVTTQLKNGGHVTAVVETSRFDANDSRVLMQVFNRDGYSTSATEFMVDTDKGSFVAPALATLSDGNFLFVFANESSDTLIGRIYSATGKLVKANFAIATGVNTDVVADIDVTKAGFEVQYAKGGKLLETRFDGNGNAQGTVTIGDAPEAGSGGSGGGGSTGGSSSGGNNGNAGGNNGGDDKGKEHVVEKTIFAGKGDDIVHSGNANDEVRGGRGSDRLFGEGGDDILKGQHDDDYLNGGAGNDTLVGGIGNDTLVGSAGNDVLKGNDGNDLMRGGDGDDKLNGGANNDTLYGDGENDTLLGADGADALYGGAGNDLLKGGDGQDYLYGGSGQNKMLGGAGKDIFVFDAAKSANRIADFQTGVDMIFIDSNLVDVKAGYEFTKLPNGFTTIEFGDTIILVTDEMTQKDIFVV